MKKIILWFIPFMFSVNLYAQNNANEPTLQETLDWLSSKCTTGFGLYHNKDGIEDEQIYVSLKCNPDTKEINYYCNDWRYLRNKADRVLFEDTYLTIHFEDLSGCQITPKKDMWGLPYVEVKLASHNKCKRKVINYDNSKHQKNPNYNYEDYEFDFDRLNYEPDTDCYDVIIKLFYREDFISSDRIIKALQHLIILTGGSLEPF
jgi:hypothetical protein